MQCENGYIRDDVRGILCRKAEEPKPGDLRSEAHALCGHQRFCPNQRCFTFLPGWERCTLRHKKDDNAAEKSVEAAGNEIAPKAAKSAPKKKRAQKAKQ